MKVKNFCDIRIRRWQGFFDPFTLQACIEFMLYPLEGENYLPTTLVSTDQRLINDGGYFRLFIRYFKKFCLTHSSGERYTYFFLISSKIYCLLLDVLNLNE